MSLPLRLLPILLAMLLSYRAVGAEKPNIVIFLADDLSWTDCSPNGGKEIPTPNMSRVADLGMVLSHAFVSSPSCAPSRNALLTGMDPIRNGSMLNHSKMRADAKRWPAYFKEQGYEVAAIGKVGHYAQVTEHGFDYASHFKYHEDDCVEEAVKWLKARQSAKPLCLFVGTNWPHVPWPKESPFKPHELKLPVLYIDTPEFRAARARYNAAVTNADRDLGLVYDAAKAKFGDDFLFLFTSDHGAQMPFAKWNCYDAGLRTPMTAVWPGKIAAKSKSDAIVGWIDLLPTCLAAVGAPVPQDISGKSFLPVLTGGAKAHRDIIFGTHSADAAYNRYPIRSARTRDWKYIRNLDPAAEHHTHIDRDAKGEGLTYWPSWQTKAIGDARAAGLIERYHKRPSEELYNVAIDPIEIHNVIGHPRNADTLAALRKELDAWMAAGQDEGLPLEKRLIEALPAKKQKAKDKD